MNMSHLTEFFKTMHVFSIFEILKLFRCSLLGARSSLIACFGSSISLCTWPFICSWSWIDSNLHHRSLCKTYTMDKQPLNTGEQKDMTNSSRTSYRSWRRWDRSWNRRCGSCFVVSSPTMSSRWTAIMSVRRKKSSTRWDVLSLIWRTCMNR